MLEILLVLIVLALGFVMYKLGKLKEDNSPTFESLNTTKEFRRLNK